MFGRRLVAKKRLFLVSFLILAIICGIFAFIKSRTFADQLENGTRVDENSDLTYYLHVKYDGIDREGVESDDNTKIDVASNTIQVTDRIPDDLIFQGFETTPTGVIGSTLRSDSSVGCSGIVIDDTQEEAVDEGTWNTAHDEYYYHGLHYSESTRTVSFRVSALQAGCQLNVGIKTKTPELNTARMDFYNNANATEKAINALSNTVHVWMGRDDVTAYAVNYRYEGDVPANAPALPESESYARGADVAVRPTPSLPGYIFEGWQTEDTTVSGDSFVMPAKEVTLSGVFVRDSRGEHTVSYEIEGDKPSSYMAPKTKSYYAGQSVELDSFENGTAIDDYTFNGWQTDSLNIQDGAFEMPEEDVIIRGSFDRDEYTVSYVYNGDIPTGAPSLPETKTYHTGDYVEIAVAPELEGYDFFGWNKQSFYMEDQDVVISGIFAEQKDTFKPGIDIAITNPKDKFEKGDIVEFEITVSNNESFDITNVSLEELLDGAVFIEGEDYQLRTDIIATIGSIPAGGSVVLRARFEVTENKDAHFDNLVSIVTAMGGLGHNFDPEGCGATVGFDTKKIPDIIDDITNPETLDKLGEIAIVLAVVGSVIYLVIVFEKKCSRRSKKVVCSCSILIVAVAFVVCGSLMFLGKVFASDEFPSEVSFESKNAKYGSKDEGAWRVTSSAELVAEDEVKLSLNVDTVAKRSQSPRDVLIVYGDGCSVRAGNNDETLNFQIAKTYNRIANESIDDIIGKNDSNRVGIISYDRNNQKITLPFGRDAEAAKDSVSLISDLSEYQCNNTYFDLEDASEPSLKVAEEFLADYEAEEGRDLYIIYLSEAMHWFDVRQKIVDGHLISGYQENYSLQYRLNQLEYEILKRQHPNLTINTLGADSYYADIYGNRADELEDYVAQIGEYREATSDNYYRFITSHNTGDDSLIELADHSYIHNYDLYDEVFDYDPFYIEQALDGRYFELKDGKGVAEQSEADPDTIIWKLDDVKSGKVRRLSAIVKFKDGYEMRTGNIYPVLEDTTIRTGLADEANDEPVQTELVESTDTPYVKNKYIITYNYNLPSGCSLPDGYEESEERSAFAVVGYPDVLECDGWTFGSYLASSNDGAITEYGSDYFRMPQSDVKITAAWKKLSIEKSMDGEIFESSPAYLLGSYSFRNHLGGVFINNPGLANYTGWADFNGMKITGIKRADSLPENFDTTSSMNIISTPDSPTPVYIWKSETLTDCTGGLQTNPSCADIYYYTTANQIYLNENGYEMLRGLEYLEDISGLQYFDASRVTDLTRFLESAKHLQDLSPLSTWHTSSLEKLEEAFVWDYRINSLEGLENFDASKLTNLSNTFGHMQKLSNIEAISDWDVSNVTDMSSLFQDTGTLPNVEPINTNPLKKWNTESLETAADMFNSSNIENVDGLITWNTENLKSMSRMFRSSKIKNVDGLITWTTPNLEAVCDFMGTEYLQNVDGLANLNISKVNDLSNCFEGSAVQDITGLANWDTSSVLSFSGMFENTSRLTSLEGLENWDTSNVAILNSMFSGSAITSTEPLAVKGITRDDGTTYQAWDVSNVTSMDYLFMNATDLVDLSGLDDWNTESLQTIWGAFMNTAITNVDALDGWKVGNIAYMNELFKGTASLTDIDGLEAWDVSNARYLKETFYGSGITSLSALHNWEPVLTGGIDSLNRTFSDTKVTSLAGIEKFHVENADALYYTFNNMSNLTTLGDAASGTGLAAWAGKTNAIKRIDSVFYNDNALEDVSAISGWTLGDPTTTDERSFYNVPTTAIGYDDAPWQFRGAIQP